MSLALITHEELRNVLMAQTKGLLNSGRSDDYLAGGEAAIEQIATSFGIALPLVHRRAVWHTGEALLIEDGGGWE